MDPAEAGWTVTTTLAAVAAGISLLTLIVTTYATGRREDVRWAREELAKAYYEFVDASYAAGQALHRHQELLWADADGPTATTSAEGLDGHAAALRHAQTKIRLLAPSRTVDRADEVRSRYRAAVEGAGPAVAEDEHQRRRVAIAEARGRFVESAKKDMALPR